MFNGFGVEEDPVAGFREKGNLLGYNTDSSV
jgi:hypothetical protein